MGYQQIMELSEFKIEIEKGIQNYPSNWRYGQKVFNYIDVNYNIARTVQYKDNIDCFYNDKNADDFIKKAMIYLFTLLII